MGSSTDQVETLNGIAAAGTGVGVLAFALFPLALPFVILTVVFTLPLALPLILLAGGGAILAGAWVVLRGLVRGIRRLHRSRSVTARPAAASASGRSRIDSRRITLPSAKVQTWK
jgi:hypothetical protein